MADFVLFGYLPSHKRIKSLKQAQTEQALVIAQAAAKSSELLSVEQQLQKLQAKVAKYQASIPPERALGAFLKEIADIMTSYDLTEQVVAPGTETKTEAVSCIPVHIKCKGKLVQIFEFFKHLQASDRLVRIEKVKLANDPDFAGPVSMEIDSVIYYRPQVEQKQPAPSSKEPSGVSGKI